MTEATSPGDGHRGWLSTIEVSELIGTSPREVVDLIERGDLVGERVGRTVLVRLDAAEQFLRRNRDTPTAPEGQPC